MTTVFNRRATWAAFLAAAMLWAAGPIAGQDEPPARPPRHGRPAKADKAEKADKGGPIVAGQGLRTTEDERDHSLEEIKKINQMSGADVQPAETPHITLWAAKDVAAVYLPDIKKLDRFLETRCKEPIRSGLDKRSAHVLLLKTRYEYESWLRAMFDVMGDPFQQSGEAGAAELKAAVLKGTGYVPQRFAVFCIEGQPADWVHRVVAVGMGYITFTQLVESQKVAPPLATGFANGLESVLAGTPEVLLFSNSYHNENRDLGADPRAWLHLVQQRITGRKVTPVRQLLQMDTTNMLLPQYAEAWTLVGALARQPAKFGELILALREDKAVLGVIERVYGWDEKTLTEHWHKYVLSQR